MQGPPANLEAGRAPWSKTLPPLQPTSTCRSTLKLTILLQDTGI